MGFKRILDVVDDSNGFIKAGNDLPVGADQEGAEEIVTPTNDFLSAIPAGTFDFVIFKLDTHFEVEYGLSPEAEAFPLHCEYDSDGWDLAVDPELIEETTPVYYMTKNTFNMWGDNPVPMDTLLAHHNVASFDDLPFKSETEKQAYQNLFTVTEDPACLKDGVPRDDFFAHVGPETEVVLIGVASNFCDADAMFGYLERGAKVTVLSDLVKGIPLGPEGREFLLGAEGIDRTEGGTMEEVLKTDRFAPYVESGKLRLVTSEDYLKEIVPAHPKSFDFGVKPR